MNQLLSEKLTGKTRILVAPLDWGLGHATRCVPIIRELLVQGVDVWLAGEGAQEELLRTEFPSLPFLHLPGYRVKYARTGSGLAWKMIQQVPKIQKAISHEQRWLKEKAVLHDFDAVISDNRYGLYHEKIPCIFITHQLAIKSSWGNWTERILQKRNYKYINRFTACWIPDREGEQSMAGELSHPLKKPSLTLHYIGWLSRFTKKETVEKKGQLLVLLSGPEPQRTILENKIIEQVAFYNGSATIVRGLPAAVSLIPSTGMIKFYNHQPSDQLEDLFREAEYIISRSGYSTVMDILALQKKAILIPTPGQTEQEWLAQSLTEKKIACCIAQKDFSLNEALNKARNFPYTPPLFAGENKLPLIIRQFLDSIR